MVGKRKGKRSAAGGHTSRFSRRASAAVPPASNFEAPTGPKNQRRAVPAGGLLTVEKVAALYGTSPRSIGRWIEAGLPVATKAKPGHAAALLDPAAVAEWLDARAVRGDGLAEAITRQLDARARRAHGKLSDLVGSLVPEALAHAAVLEAASAVFDGVLAVACNPDLLRRLASEADPARVLTLLESELRAALQALSDRFEADVTTSAAGDDWPPALPEVRVSTTVAGARTRLLELQTMTLEIKERSR